MNLPEHEDHAGQPLDKSGTTKNFTDYISKTAPKVWTSEA